jgi:DNA-cytosine methyltransferase
VLKLGSLFSGCAGLDLSFMNVGFLPMYDAEVEKHASALLRTHHPGVPNLGDVTLISGKHLPQVDVLTFGSPCQDISRANTKPTFGLHDSRSGLIWQVLRLVAEMETTGSLPGVLVWENVDTLVEPKNHAAYMEVVEGFASYGYEYKTYVELALEAGIPQLRKRCITLFSRLGARFPEVAGRRGSATTISDILEGYGKDEFTDKVRSQLLRQLYRQRLGNSSRDRTLRVRQVETWLGLHPGREPDEWQNKCVCYSPTYTCTPQIERISTLTKQDAPWVRLPSGIRRKLTVGELERAFGLPQGHTLLGIKPDGSSYLLSDLQRRAILGNAVVPAAVEGIASWANQNLN